MSAWDIENERGTFRANIVSSHPGEFIWVWSEWPVLPRPADGSLPKYYGIKGKTSADSVEQVLPTVEQQIFEVTDEPQ